MYGTSTGCVVKPAQRRPSARRQQRCYARIFHRFLGSVLRQPTARRRRRGQGGLEIHSIRNCILEFALRQRDSDNASIAQEIERVRSVPCPLAQHLGPSGRVQSLAGRPSTQSGRLKTFRFPGCLPSAHTLPGLHPQACTRSLHACTVLVHPLKCFECWSRSFVH